MGSQGEGLAWGVGTMSVRQTLVLFFISLTVSLVFLFLSVPLCPVFTDNADELQQSLTQPECLLRLHVHIAL